MKLLQEKKVYLGVNNACKNIIEELSLEKGNIRKFYRSDSSYIKEVYTSDVPLGVSKGWKLHRLMTCRLYSLKGTVKFYVRDENFENEKNFTLCSTDNEFLIVPPNHWFLFQSVGEIAGTIMNLADTLHSPNESIIREIKE